MSSSTLPAGPCRMWGSAEFRNVFYNQYVVVLGDSIQRGIYKDLVKLYQTDEQLTPAQLRAKGEPEFLGDTLLRRSPLSNGKEYEEVRVFHRDSNIFKYFFLTKVYSDYVESVVFSDLKKSPPDIIIVNSCVWDMTRYGPEAISEYKISLERFFTRLVIDKIVPDSTEIIWLSTLPLGASIKGGFIVQTVKFMDVSRLRLDVLEANRWVAENVSPFYDINFLDLHYMLANFQDWRELDGLHWNGYAHRYITSALCEFVEYLNIRARSRQRESSSTSDTDVVPKLHSNLSSSGPLRLRKVISCEARALNLRSSSSHNDSRNRSNLHNTRNDNSRSSSGLSSQSRSDIFTDNNFSGTLFQDTTFSRPFWANSDFAKFSH